jgi:two-component system, NarL family, sensor histidine kinase DevS
VMTITVSQAGREALADAWVALLQKAFRPESATTVHTSDDPTTAQAPTGPTDDAVRISRDGSLLHVPHLPRGEVQLQRRQPFTPTDRELAEALWRLTSHGLITKDSYEAGVKRERRRIAADLHDSIGGRLLHLSQTAASTQQRQYAINTLADLRNITRGLSKEGAAWSQVLADLRHQVQRELDAVDVDLHWACDWPAEALAQFADGEEAVAVHCVASELVRNALQHAQPDRLSVHWRTTPEGLRELEVRHGGYVSEPSLWPSGLGVNSIRRRFLDRQGHCEWALVDGELVFTGQWPPKADQP